MTLSGKEIFKEHDAGNIAIDDMDLERQNPNSYNLRLSDELLIYDTDYIDPVLGYVSTANGPLDMKKQNPYHIVKIPETGYTLMPFRIYLARTMERTTTKKFVPMLEGRSSVGRLGVCIHATAGFGDVGFDGFWTLELFCIQPVRIYPWTEICQIYYHEIKGEYDEYTSGKYQWNTGVQPSMMYKDFVK